MPSLWQGHRRAILLIVGLALFWSIGLGDVPLFDWDEVNFAECSREMRATGQYLYAQIGFLPFWEKPPLFFWLQSLSMELWGENAFGARFPNVLIAALTLWILYRIGRRWHDESFGLIWLFLYAISLLPSFYARSGLIDPLFNLFMLLSTVQGTLFLIKGKILNAGGMGFFAGLATLTKGPVGLLMPGLAVGTLAVLLRRFRSIGMLGVWGGLFYLGIVGGWIALIAAQCQTRLLEDFWAYQWRLFATPDAGHGGPWYYHLVVVAAGMFPASFWALPGGRDLSPAQEPMPTAVVLLSLWSLLIFSIVKTKILHYSSLSYYGVAYLGARAWHGRADWIQRQGWLMVGVATMLLGMLTILAAPLMSRSDLWLSWIQDAFVRMAIVETPILWEGWEGWTGFILLGGISVLYLGRFPSRVRLYLLGVMLAVWQSLTLAVWAPRIEAYSQGPLREFAQQCAAEGAVLWALGFKSYIPYFYGRMQPETSPRQEKDVIAFQNLILMGKASFPAYLVVRGDRFQESLLREYRLKIVERRGAYVFLQHEENHSGQALFP
ncbi:MAG: glycosyltransferase family 39 protein [Bacteroidia bacterium]|nr:glycosyltransferase family 39 protein [Bacteroidia bacterium]